MSGVPYLFVNMLALSCFALLFATFLAAKKTPEIRAFLLLLGACVVWLGGAVLMRLQVWPGLEFWFYVSILTLFAVEWLFYLFLLRFTKTREPFTLAVWTVVNAVELAFTASGFFLKPPVPVASAEGTVFLYAMSWRILFPVLFYAVFTAYLTRLVRRVVREQGIHSPGLLLVILGGVFMGLGNVLQVTIPGNTFPYDALFGIGFAAFLLLALYKKRMFRLTLVISRSLLLILLGLICMAAAVYILSPLERFFVDMLRLPEEAATMAVALLFALVLFLATMVAKRLIESLFTREEQQNRLLKQFSDEVTQSLSTSEIMEKLSDAILGEIPAERVYVCLREEDRFVGRYCSNPLASLAFSIPADSPQVTYLREQESYFLVSEFSCTPLYLSVWAAEKELFRRLNIDCVVAMRNGREIVGLILLCAKDRSFNYVEICFLETVSSIASIAMKNASLYEKMFREARIDSLTGVYNYRYFMELLEEQFKSYGQDSLSLVYVDVDDFKLYNQLYGVGEGDAALRRISEALTLCVGGEGTVFRTSGKVFGILLPGKDTQRSTVLAEEIRRRIADVNAAPDRCRMKPLSVSIGICTAPYAASSAKELMNNADLATYNAKQNGKDQVMVFRGSSFAGSQQLAERTLSIVERIERRGTEKRSAMAMISALTAAIDAKDHYTYDHSKNVARYAANLAVGMGLNDDQVRTIYAAGLLHDIGKISVPEDILNKSGKLSPDEYRVMQTHVNSSIEMIRHLPEMDYLVPAVLSHHEHWDGTGYPRGLAGEEIPIAARCLAVADGFDAMTTDRPYRKCLPLKYALRQLESGAGTQFDPALAAVFIGLVKKGEIPLSPQVCRESPVKVKNAAAP